MPNALRSVTSAQSESVIFMAFDISHLWSTITTTTTHRSQEINVINFQEARKRGSKSINSRESQFKGSVHQKASEDIAEHVPVLWLANQRAH